MVTLDPCTRLNAIRDQLIPAMLTGAKENTSSDIKTAIEKNLPQLEKNCHALAQKCKKKWPECENKFELCNKENIDRLFKDTREKLEVIWKERAKQELQSYAERIARNY